MIKSSNCFTLAAENSRKLLGSSRAIHECRQWEGSSK